MDVQSWNVIWVDGNKFVGMLDVCLCENCPLPCSLNQPYTHVNGVVRDRPIHGGDALWLSCLSIIIWLMGLSSLDNLPSWEGKDCCCCCSWDSKSDWAFSKRYTFVQCSPSQL